jgi:hypothetical protein
MIARDDPLSPIQRRNSSAQTLTPATGNIVPKAATPTPPDDLETPTLKTPKYTTGRGGSGNMANNNLEDPSEARRSQDVGPAVSRYSETESHFGRGE